ncbi:hypothetical protein ACTGVR_03945 [Streptococcus suis]|nr:hypothetical protein A7J10_02640 [Streptococcus suis]KPA68265.1 hypothetical protein XK27_02845 [Streptococcus suis]NQL71275.1 hypothetical protein [Streptococcus suis]HEM4294148.1 hypothetical protein [Streptococcus suis]
MAEKVLDSYEELISYTAEVREGLDIIRMWLQTKPKDDDYWTYHDLIATHGQHFALLNMIMYRMDSLIAEHSEILKQVLQKGE